MLKCISLLSLLIVVVVSCLAFAVEGEPKQSNPADAYKRINYTVFQEHRYVHLNRPDNFDHFSLYSVSVGIWNVSLELLESNKQSRVYKMTMSLVMRTVDGTLVNDKSKMRPIPQMYRCKLNADGILQEMEPMGQKTRMPPDWEIASLLFKTKDDVEDKVKVKHRLGPLAIHRANLKVVPKPDDLGSKDSSRTKRTKWYSPQTKMYLYAESEMVQKDEAGRLTHKRYRAQIPRKKINEWYYYQELNAEPKVDK